MGLIEVLIAVGVVILIIFVAGMLTDLKNKKPKDMDEEKQITDS